MYFENQKFTLQAIAEGTPSISTAFSSQIFVIKYRIQIDSVEGNPIIFYKDQGGKDKTINLNVSVRDERNNLANRKVPLQLLLLYENGHQVINQDILKVIGGNKVIDELGIAHFRLRIEEVSKNHQKLKFQIEFRPDNFHLNGDICSELSPLIEVRSKIKHKKGDYNNTNQQEINDEDGEEERLRQYQQQQNQNFNNQELFNQIVPISSTNPFDEISNWISSLVSQLNSNYQWRKIGEDVDTKKDLYSMKNPNEFIREITQQ